MLVLACCPLGVSDAVLPALPAFVAPVVFDGDEVAFGWLAAFAKFAPVASCGAVAPPV
jgi:hypothetical protein